MAPTEAIQQLVEVLHDTSIPARNRAETAAYLVNEFGLDVIRGGLELLVKEADEGRELKAKVAEEERTPLSPEKFIGRIDDGLEPMAAVTTGHTDCYLPCKADEIEGLKCGDPILLDVRKAKIAGRNGHIPSTGDIATVVNVPKKHAEFVIVKHEERKRVARLPHWMMEEGFEIEPGMQVIYDPVRRFVLEEIESESDGTDLLSPVEVIEKIDRSQLGAVHPVLDEMIFRAQQMVSHPDWARQMKARPVGSFLLSGPTGTGKTMHINVLAREMTDYVEELTGQRVSRLIIVDAGSFYSPLFGATEQNIISFFDRLKNLGAQVLRTRDGKEVRVPLIVVLEECEALLRSRGEAGGSAHLFDRPLGMLLQKMSSAGESLDFPCIFVATSNRADLLDSAARRRFGVRQVIFGTLSAGQAVSVLSKKIPEDLPLRNGATCENVIGRIISYLYGEDPEQGIAEVRMVDGNRRVLCRRDLVTGAMLEEAVSAATDESLRHSADAGHLLGLDAAGVIRSLNKQFLSLAATLRPHNLREHCPEWFSDESMRVEMVRSLVTNARRPRSLLLD